MLGGGGGKLSNFFWHFLSPIYNLRKFYVLASEMWCLARFLPLMIRNHVPEDDSKWELFLDFLTTLDYVFVPSTNLDIVAYVRLLIGDHLTRFR